MISTSTPASIGILKATQEDLQKQCLDMHFKAEDLVWVRVDPDTRYLQISRRGIHWYSIHSEQVQIYE